MWQATVSGLTVWDDEQKRRPRSEQKWVDVMLSILIDADSHKQSDNQIEFLVFFHKN